MKTRTLLAGLLAAPLALALFAGVASADTLTRSLDIGSQGSDVSSLQTFLTGLGSTIYPSGLVTGYYGSLTSAAVGRFQAQNGIVSSGSPATTGYGRVGPQTMAVLNAQMGGTSSLSEGAGKVTNVGTLQPVLSNLAVNTTSNSATVTWNSNVAGTAKVWYSTNPSFNYNTAPYATTAGYTTAESVTIPNLQSGTTYYFVVESLDNQGNFSWSQNVSSFKTQ